MKIIIIAATVVDVLLTCFSLITSFDFPWQLAEGQFILNHGSAAHSVFQAYGDISPDFVNEYVLYEVNLAAIYAFFGQWGPIIFFAFISFIIYISCLVLFYKSTKLSLWLLLLFFSAQLVITLRSSGRPELISFPCFVALGTLLIRHLTSLWNGFDTLKVGFLFFIWANVHGSFLIGLGMMGLWYGQSILWHRKHWAQIKNLSRPVSAALLGSALNPYGIYRFAQPFQLHGLLWGQATSMEMWPLPLRMDWLPLICTLPTILILLLSRDNPRHWWLIVTVIVLQYLTFNSYRYEVFTALALLVAIGHSLNCSRELPRQVAATSPLISIVTFGAHCLFAGAILLLIENIVYFKRGIVGNQLRYLDSRTLLVTNSSFLWLKRQPGDYYFLSTLGPGSWVQLPNARRLHPLMDSGTHRFSESVNKLYYYCLFDPNTFRNTLSTLKVNALIVGPSNYYWASLINRSPDWRLSQIDSDSQCYLRSDQSDTVSRSDVFLKWQITCGQSNLGPEEMSIDQIMRGIGLRPDNESLDMLLGTVDVSWMMDPQIAYINEWISQLPDDLVKNALKEIDDKKTDSASGLKLLFCLRLKEYQKAEGIARKWNPGLFSNGFQEMQELRAQSFILAGDSTTAAQILAALWPQPRYSLRWATLCGLIYSDHAESMPQNARLLLGMDLNTRWQDDVIKSLNQNINVISAETP